MKVLVTGSKGFIGKNLCLRLSEIDNVDIIEIDKDSSDADLEVGLEEAEFIFHLAGVNRPREVSEFSSGNSDFTDSLLSKLKCKGKSTPILITSSIQAELNNPYGKSKAKAEDYLEQYSRETGAKCYIYRLPNVFGKWCRPNYNSVVATFCHNIYKDIDIKINEPDAQIRLVYIDDVCDQFIKHISKEVGDILCQVDPVYRTTVGEIAQMIKRFKESKVNLVSERVGVGFTRALYSTYISYFDPKDFQYSIPEYTDARGTFSEFLKTKDSGQFSFFTAHPGVTRGGHYHHTKNEKFLVVKGTARFRFVNVISGETYDAVIGSDELRVVETIPGWTHDVTNIGNDELLVMLWANEIFDRERPDTIAREIK